MQVCSAENTSTIEEIFIEQEHFEKIIFITLSSERMDVFWNKILIYKG